MAIIKVNDNLLKGDMGDLVELLQGIFETPNLIRTDFMNVKASQEKEEVRICFSISVDAFGKTGQKAHDALRRISRR